MRKLEKACQLAVLMSYRLLIVLAELMDAVFCVHYVENHYFFNILLIYYMYNTFLLLILDYVYESIPDLFAVK